MPFKHSGNRFRRTSVSPPGRGLNHYTHVELDQIHARLTRNNISLSSRHTATANHGLRVDKIDFATSLILQFIAGDFGEHTAQQVQGRPDERVAELNLELKSLLQTLTLAKLANSANLQFVNLHDSGLTETVNVQIRDCCAALGEFLDGIRKETSLGSRGWWSSVLRWNGLDERKWANFRANLSDTRKLLREFMLTLTETLDSRHPAPVNTPDSHMFRSTALTYGPSDDEGPNLENDQVSNHTHSRMFQDSNRTNIDGASINSVGHDMLQVVEHSTNTTRTVFNVVVNGTANLSPILFNPQYGTTPILSNDEIPPESMVASQSTAHSPSSPTPSLD